MSQIEMIGARENNLKNVDLTIPRNKVVCFVGVSGSGKSTIAFDIVAKEGQRQYFESLSSYARRYLVKSNRPDVDEIKGVSATIVISQDRVHGSPRSTVGTLTEVYTYLRLLYSRVGLPSLDSSFFSFNHPNGACPACKGLGQILTIDPKKIVDFEKSLNQGALIPKEWKVNGRMWNIIRATHYFDMDKKVKDFSKEELDNLLYHKKELFQEATDYGANRWTYQGIVTRMTNRDNSTSRGPASRDHVYYSAKNCFECGGGRLNKKSLGVKINGKNIGEVANLSLEGCLEFVKNVPTKQAEVVKPRLEKQLKNLISVGVGYLTLNRSTDTLSGGEAQRVKMARQLGCDLVETIYVLDEPTAGLHPRDVEGVVNNLRKLKEGGNSVIVVEHDETVMKSADHIIEVGPGRGKEGGEIVAQGSVKQIMANSKSLTGQYLNGNKKINSRSNLRSPSGYLQVVNANRHNLKNLNLEIPTGILVALTGVSGSGKSSLVEEIIAQHAEKVVLVDQGSMGANKRGCIATYVGVFDEIRQLFARESGMHPSLFSFNSHGACENCQGLGFLEMEMNFLGDVKIKCEVCGGKRYKEKVLRYKLKGKNIAEVLLMTASEVHDFFDSLDIKEKMDLLNEVGLGYLEMGQTLDTLSGGESQRLKLASRLQAKGEFYILDEPTSGLHFADVEKLLGLLNRLVENGNTVLVVEHNLDVIKNADWVIDLGPDGGDKGGMVVGQGTPSQLTEVSNSLTGQYLKAS